MIQKSEGGGDGEKPPPPPKKIQLDRGTRPREMGSAFPSRVSLLLSILRLNLVLTYGIPLEFRGGVQLFI